MAHKSSVIDPHTDASKFLPLKSIPLKSISPSDLIARSESASVRQLGSESIPSVTDPEMTPTDTDYYSTNSDFPSSSIGSDMMTLSQYHLPSQRMKTLEPVFGEVKDKSGNKTRGGPFGFWKARQMKMDELFDMIIAATTIWPFGFKREPLENLAPDDIVIVVVGPTGTGKSTFINTAAGANLLEVVKTTPDGKKLPLSPCTKEFAHVRCKVEGSRGVVFVDTPAMPDPDGNGGSLEEEEVRKKIRDWLNRVFGKSIKVSGILHLHNIIDDPPLPHFGMFRKLCGKEFAASVILVLTMSEKVDPTYGQARKAYLTEYWKRMISERGLVFCHDGTKQSAWNVVKALGPVQ